MHQFLQTHPQKTFFKRFHVKWLNAFQIVTSCLLSKLSKNVNYFSPRKISPGFKTVTAFYYYNYYLICKSLLAMSLNMFYFNYVDWSFSDVRHVSRSFCLSGIWWKQTVVKADESLAADWSSSLNFYTQCILYYPEKHDVSLCRPSFEYNRWKIKRAGTECSIWTNKNKMKSGHEFTNVDGD